MCRNESVLDQHLQPSWCVTRHHQGLIVHGLVHVVCVLAQHGVDSAQHIVTQRYDGPLVALTHIGWSIAVVFCALLPRDQVQAVIKNKVDAVEWVDASKPGHRLAFDHQEQLSFALHVLRGKVDRQALPLHLMLENFYPNVPAALLRGNSGQPAGHGSFSAQTERLSGPSRYR